MIPTSIKGLNNFRNLPVNNTIFKGITFFNDSNLNTKFTEICEKIYSGQNISDISKLYMEKIQTSIISKGYDNLLKVIGAFIENKINDFRNDIQISIFNNDFDVKKVLDNFRIMNSNFNKLKIGLHFIENNFKQENGKKLEYSFVNTVKNIVFFKQIIETPFISSTGEKELYFYELFTEYFDKCASNNELEDVDTIIGVYNSFYDFYKRFSYCVKDNKEREDYFSKSIFDKMQFQEKTSEKFLTKVIESITSSITKIYKLKDVSDLETQIRNVRRIINLSPEICDKTIFMNLYRKSLNTRLKNPQYQNISYKLEEELLKSIDPNYDIDNYIKMRNQINDIRMLSEHHKYYKEIEIVPSETSKYYGYDMKQVNRNITNFNIYRSYDWDYNLENRVIYNLPLDLMIYHDMFNAYFKDRYTNRALFWNYDESISVIETKFDKTYNIQMTVPQLAVFMEINNTPGISVQTLNTKNNIPLDELNIVLNSLIISKLVNKSDNITFEINNSFVSKDENISIVALYHKLKQMKNIQNTEQKIVKEQPSITVIKGFMFGKIISEKTISKENIIDLANKNFDVIIQDDIMNQVIGSILQIKNITYDDTTKMFEYKVIDDENIDDDSDDDSDDNNSDNDMSIDEDYSNNNNNNETQIDDIKCQLDTERPESCT